VVDMKKETARKGLNTIGRYRQYFVAGHSRWFVFVMGLTNFSLIFYNFLWIRLDFIPDNLKSIYVFLFIFFITYVPLATLFGYLDLTRGTFRAEASVSLRVNPITRRQFKELAEIRKQNERILEMLNNEPRNR